EEEARLARLASSKAEHVAEELRIELHSTKEELQSASMVVDEASEAARLRQQVSSLRTDLEAKSRAAIAGWDAAASAESELNASSMRGDRAGYQRGIAEMEEKINVLKEKLIEAQAAAAADATAVAAAAAEQRLSSSPERRGQGVRAVEGKDPVVSGDEGAAGAGIGSRGGAEEGQGEGLVVGEAPHRTEEGRGGALVLESSTSGLGDSSVGVRSDGRSRSDGGGETREREVVRLERELVNVRERERDALEEAERLGGEIEQLREGQREAQQREDDLMAMLGDFESEKAGLQRQLIVAEDRATVAMELASAHESEAAKARQETALQAARVRRASKAGGLPAGAVEALGGRRLSVGAGSSNRQFTEQLKSALGPIRSAIKEGTSLWRNGKRAECRDLYAKVGETVAGQLPAGSVQDDLRVALRASRGLPPAKAAVALRKALDTVLEAVKLAKEETKAPDKDDMATAIAIATADVANERAGVDVVGVSGRGHDRDGRSRRESYVDVLAGDNLGLSRVASLQRQLKELEERGCQAAADSPVTAGTELGGTEPRGLVAAVAALSLARKRCKDLEGNEEASSSHNHGKDDVGNERMGSTSGRPTSTAQVAGGRGGGSGSKVDDQKKIKLLEKKAKEDGQKVQKLEAQLAKAEEAMSKAGDAATSGGGVDTAKVAEKQVAAAEKKFKKAMGELEKNSQKLSSQLTRVTSEVETFREEVASLVKERDALKKQVSDMGRMGKEIEDLRLRATEADQLQLEVKAATERLTELEGLYRDEQLLRKKYWNMMEDMKGKIRVFARCRPMARYELDRGCQRAVNFLDEATLEVTTVREPKQFVFDSVFSENRTQADIFDDTKNLVQSAMDGYNVCVFAYGQTGSGKTFTMAGAEGDLRGLTPRAIDELYEIATKSKGALEARQGLMGRGGVSCYFVELYLDNLRDLFYAMENPRDNNPPKLDIKVDAKKMVFIKNVVIKEAGTAEELLQLFTRGNAQRKVGGTKMNAESSRSHSIFGILVEVLNRTTKKTSTGKLSLVDLAGSERADKTGATGERIKEAQSINKSLSALGDVISALSSGEKFVPYRNNKLTQMMQDSLGGNAKTLMFVNISPADYNREETLTALQYAARVKQIVNDASKQQDSKEVSRLKGIIQKLKAGESIESDDGE
ncbi:unnamed protein product, partial [Discosporangium mesarthrocarpum]